MSDIYKRAHKIWDNQHRIGSPTYYLRRLLLLKRISQFIKKNDEVLDIGCGTGDYLLEMAKYKVKLNGFDYSKYAIEKAKKKLIYQKADLKVSNLENFNSKKKYDFIFISEVLEHIKDDFEALRKITSFLNKKGKIIISVPFDQNLWKYESHQPYDDLRRYSKKELKQLANKAGLSVIRLDCYGFPFLRFYYFLTRPWRKKSETPLKREGIIKRIIKVFVFSLFKIMVNFDRLFLSTDKGVGLVLIAQKK